MLRKPGTYERLEELGDRLERALRGAVRHGATLNRVGSMLTLFFCPGPVRRFSDAQRADLGLFARYWRHMLEQGIYLAPSQFEATMVSLALTDADLTRIEEASSAFFAAAQD